MRGVYIHVPAEHEGEGERDSQSASRTSRSSRPFYRLHTWDASCTGELCRGAPTEIKIYHRVCAPSTHTHRGIPLARTTPSPPRPTLRLSRLAHRVKRAGRVTVLARINSANVACREVIRLCFRRRADPRPADAFAGGRCPTQPR